MTSEHWPHMGCSFAAGTTALRHWARHRSHVPHLRRFPPQETALVIVQFHGPAPCIRDSEHCLGVGGLNVWQDQLVLGHCHAHQAVR
jgi:hypothetical protein